MKKVIASWMKYAFGEGLTKTTSSSLSKFIGVVSDSLGIIVFATLIISVIQMTIGLISNMSYHRANLFPGIKSALGSILFGVIAFVMTIIGIFIFTYEDADLGITTFIVLFSIFPGALFDWLFFKDSFSIRQWLGTGIFLLSGYAVLNFPTSEMLLSLPPWIWLSVIIAMLLAVNELITRFVSTSIKTNPLAHNFWVGLSATTMALLYLTITKQWQLATELPSRIFVIPIIMGIITFVMISFKFLSYKTGSTITFKKIVMQGTYLITAMVAGSIFFSEPFTFGKIVSIFGFFIAFSLISNDVWNLISSKIILWSRKEMR